MVSRTRPSKKSLKSQEEFEKVKWWEMQKRCQNQLLNSKWGTYGWSGLGHQSKIIFVSLTWVCQISYMYVNDRGGVNCLQIYRRYGSILHCTYLRPIKYTSFHKTWCVCKNFLMGFWAWLNCQQGDSFPWITINGADTISLLHCQCSGPNECL